MKILVAHNFYRSDAPSGENSVVVAELAQLRKSGLKVEEYVARSDSLVGGGIGLRARAAVSAIHSQRVAAEVSSRLRDNRPDVLHVHNVFPLIGPAIIRTAVRMGVPVVQTIHNYRHSCVNGLHFRDGSACTDCVGRLTPWPAVKHGCYQGSRLHSVPMAASSVINRGVWAQVSRYIALTPFMRTQLVNQGFDPTRVVVRPTPSDDLGRTPPPGANAPLLYIGRLDSAKGIPLLLDAYEGSHTTRPLWIGGTGPQADRVEAYARKDSRVRYLGGLDAQGVRLALQGSAAVVVPSLCLEGFPRVVAEAFSVGRPILTVAGGSVGSIVGSDLGWTVAPETSTLRKALEDLSVEEILKRGLNGRRYYEANCEPTQSMHCLLRIYSGVMGRSDP